MKINEIFVSIQGEGQYAGYPTLFIRLSGCTRNCFFCDTNYHKMGYNFSYEYIVKTIKKANKKLIVWTGGEPLLQLKQIKDIIKLVGEDYSHHLETNGDLIKSQKEFNELFQKERNCRIRGIIEEDNFDYICVSPKDLQTARRINKFSKKSPYRSDIKVVTDLTLNKKLIPYATILMPLTINTENDLRRDTPLDPNKEIRQNVWNYCVKHNIRYSSRLHYEVWGWKRGV